VTRDRTGGDHAEGEAGRDRHVLAQRTRPPRRLACAPPSTTRRARLSRSRWGIRRGSAGQRAIVVLLGALPTSRRCASYPEPERWALSLGAKGIFIPESMWNYRNCGDPPSAGSRAQMANFAGTVTIPPRDAGPRLKIVVSRVGIRISPGLVTAASACRRSSAPPPARRLQGTSLGRVRAPAFLGQTLALPRRALAAVSSLV
jgi:hypothetical protein